MLTNFNVVRLISSMSNDDVKVIFNQLENLHSALEVIVDKIKPKLPSWSRAELEAELGCSAEDYLDKVFTEMPEDKAAVIRQQGEAKWLQRQNPTMELFLGEFEKIRAKLSEITKGTA